MITIKGEFKKYWKDLLLVIIIVSAIVFLLRYLLLGKI